MTRCESPDVTSIQNALRSNSRDIARRHSAPESGDFTAELLPSYSYRSAIFFPYMLKCPLKKCLTDSCAEWQRKGDGYNRKENISKTMDYSMLLRRKWTHCAWEPSRVCEWWRGRPSVRPCRGAQPTMQPATSNPSPHIQYIIRAN